MSEENVEIVRRMVAAWNAGDMDAFRELHDADAIVRPVQGWPEPGPFVGREAAVRWYAQLLEAFDIDVFEQPSYIDAGDRVMQFIWHGFGRGPQASQEFSAVVTVRRGRVVLMEFFWDHAEALEAAGLSE